MSLILVFVVGMFVGVSLDVSLYLARRATPRTPHE